MGEKVGRNDPCPCGSGKKYKSCCFLKEQKQKSPLGGRKFKAKVLSAGGVHKPQETQKRESAKPVDYMTLMERSFGEALHSNQETFPVLSNPSEFLMEPGSEEKS